MGSIVARAARTLAGGVIIAVLCAPANAAGISAGVGASVGGSGGINAGAGASVGGSGGISAEAGASIGAAGGVNALGVAVGGSSDVGAGLGASVGGESGIDAGVGATVGGAKISGAGIAPKAGGPASRSIHNGRWVRWGGGRIGRNSKRPEFAESRSRCDSGWGRRRGDQTECNAGQAIRDRGRAAVASRSGINSGVGTANILSSPSILSGQSVPSSSQSNSNRARLVSAAADISGAQLTRMKKRCVDVLNSQDSYDRDLRQLCLLIARR